MVLGITLKLPYDMRVWWNGRHKGLGYSQCFGRGSTYNTHQKSLGEISMRVRVSLPAPLTLASH